MANLLFTRITKTCKIQKHANLLPCKIEKLKLLQHSINFQTPTYKLQFKRLIPSCNLRGTRKTQLQFTGHHQHTKFPKVTHGRMLLKATITNFFIGNQTILLKKEKKRKLEGKERGDRPPRRKDKKRKEKKEENKL